MSVPEPLPPDGVLAAPADRLVAREPTPVVFKIFQQNQVVLLDTLEQEISKFKECHSMLDINALFTEAKHYHAKLVNIRKEMLMLHEKTSKLKKRALKLQQKRQKEELEREQQREKEFEREKQLTAKPAKRT
uniref:Biogenesis of lysosomal organelles complex 1 subunit 6 n=1 Tax=Rousettus aegyptiacus TaxID=9407 RepID=A0A7J8IG34_ROUAE|nr:biogenesis of lysosomal organelles complex 1 subunit 6 [Rousettus aegyptiacus]